MKRLLPLLFFLPSIFAVAQDPPDLPALIGLSLQDAIQKLGAPAEVFSARGGEEWQDDVVFYYPQHLYLFWYQNRVWQVRLDQRYAREFLGLKMGQSREAALAALGSPFKELADSLVYQLEDRGYPVRARLYFENGLLRDAYCFRGDL